MKEIAAAVAEESGKKAGSIVIEDIYKMFIKPRLEKIKNKPKDAEIIFDIIEEYLKEAYQRNKYMNTIVFNRETNTIDDLYVPLTIVKNGKSYREKIVIDEDMENIFEKLHRILIIDTAGMGKSTLAKFAYLKCLEKNYGIPFLIELRKLEKGKSLLQYICDELRLSRKELTPEDIRFIVEKGEFIFFLDGYDEISKEDKEEITEEIRKFIVEFSGNSFLLTSREDESINMFSDFEKYHIRPLDKNEAYELIRKYDKNGELAERLIKEIESNEQYEILEEFLENPLMVSLLYCSYHYKGKIQYKKHLFYRQVYDALYEGHDIVKGSSLIHTKESKLDIEDFNWLLSIVGYLSIRQNKISFYRNEILKIIKQAIGLMNYHEEISENDFLEDLLHAVPILVKDGIEYKWAHKSFAEYYAAYFICFIEKDHENQIIYSIMNSSNNLDYHNVLDFCYDMDPKMARETITYNLVKQFVEYCDANEIDAENKTEVLHRYYSFIDTIRFIKTLENVERKQEKNKHYEARAMIEAVQMYRENVVDEVFSYFNTVSRNYNVFMFVGRKPAYEIVKLLFEKNVDIFEEIKEREYAMKFWNDIDVGIYLWGENEDDLFKENESRKAITSYVHHKNFSTLNRILSYEKCLDKKEKIEQEMKKPPIDLYSFS